MGNIENGYLGMKRPDLWLEARPAPLVMTDKQILDWLGEYCDQAIYTRPTSEYTGGFTLYCDEAKTQAPTLRGAVCMAAAKMEEANT